MVTRHDHKSQVMVTSHKSWSQVMATNHDNFFVKGRGTGIGTVIDTVTTANILIAVISKQ